MKNRLLLMSLASIFIWSQGFAMSEMQKDMVDVCQKRCQTGYNTCSAVMEIPNDLAAITQNEQSRKCEKSNVDCLADCEVE